MNIVYYPDMYIPEETLKTLLLFWGNVSSIVPPSVMEYNEAYLNGEIKHEINYPLETYKRILDRGGERIVDFLVISDSERTSASEKMFDLITKWNKDAGFYNSLKIYSVDNLVGKWVEWYWFLHEKLEQPLVELMLEERLVVNWAPGEIVGYQEVGKSYMSIIADEIRRNRNIRMVTDDEFSIAAKSGVNLTRLASEREAEDSYQFVSMAIPQVFIPSRVIKALSWNTIIKIRNDLLPYAENYYAELEQYQQLINSLQLQEKDTEALEKFCELCERVSISFKPFSLEVSKILRLIRSAETISFITGIVLPTVKLLISQSDLAKACDIGAISIMAPKYALSRVPTLAGFEYLENLNRKLQIQRMKGMVTCLFPKGVRKILPRRK